MDYNLQALTLLHDDPVTKSSAVVADRPTMASPFSTDEASAKLTHLLGLFIDVSTNDLRVVLNLSVTMPFLRWLSSFVDLTIQTTR